VTPIADSERNITNEIAMPYEVRRWRFMFSEGETLDVLTPYSDSRVKDFAYRAHFGKTAGKGNDQDRIVGSICLGPVAPNDSSGAP
jgi:hypothetical protein